MEGILKGIRVIDLTQYQMGPVANQMLADMGAEVIKIERLEGEPGRRIGPFTSGGRSAYFQAHNGNKKSVAINLKHQRGMEILYKLVGKADVFSENFQRGVAEKLGFGYETLVKMNPQMIYFSGSGFGLEGPMSQYLAYDAVGQAMSGILSTIWSPPGQPNPLIGCAIGDQTGGFLGCLAIVLALFHRQRTGEGQRVDVSLLGSGIALMGWVLQAFLLTGTPYRAKTRARITPAAISSTHLAKDDKPIIIQLLGNDKVKEGLKVLGLEGFLNNPIFKLEEMDQHAEQILSILDSAFKKKNREDWLRSFAEAGVVAAPVLNCEEASNHPQVLINGYVDEVNHPKEGKMKVVGCPIKFSKTPGKMGPAPELGEHTESVLSEFLEYSEAEIADLRKVGVIR